MGLQEYLDEERKIERRRYEPSTTGHATSTSYFSNGVVSSQEEFDYADGRMQETFSLYNPLWNWRWYVNGVPTRARDSGGPFFTRTVQWFSGPQEPELTALYGSGAVYENYTGLTFPTQVIARDANYCATGKWHETSLWTSDNAVTRRDLTAEGLKFVRQAVPTTPAFGAARALGELREGIGHIPTLANLTNNAAGEWLNLQFAILPTASDAQGFYDSLGTASQVIEQLKASANAPIRRRRSRPTTVTTDTTVVNNAQLFRPGGVPLPAYLVDGGGRLSVTRLTTRDLWFSGSFRYFVPDKISALEQWLREKQRAYGVLPTPEVIWQLTPFSWLVDWFVNVDDAIFSVYHTGTDGSFLEYGYVMARSVITTSYDWEGRVNIRGKWRTVRYHWSSTEEIKQRERAGAYAPQWTGDELTLKQLSILAALGISSKL